MTRIEEPTGQAPTENAIAKRCLSLAMNGLLEQAFAEAAKIRCENLRRGIEAQLKSVCPTCGQ